LWFAWIDLYMCKDIWTTTDRILVVALGPCAILGAVCWCCYNPIDLTCNCIGDSKMRIYLASFFETRERLQEPKNALWKMGHEITSSWLDEAPMAEFLPTKEIFWKKLAMKDLAELNAADSIILDTLDINPRGGREVEFGFALACWQTKLVSIVGPYRNVFHTLADKQFDNWDLCLEWYKNPHADSLNKSRIDDPVKAKSLEITGTPFKKSIKEYEKQN